MANKKGAKESTVVDAAQATGSAAGKIASPGGATRDVGSAPAKARKKGKLIKKKTSRLPRKQKKAQQKAAAAKS
jgi:hypothetical protein